MRTVLFVLYSLLNLYSLLVLVYCILSWVRVNNKFTAVVNGLVEPVLNPIRRLLQRVLPANWRMFDLSPWVLILLIRILNMFVYNYLRLFRW